MTELQCAFIRVTPANGWTVVLAVHGGIRLISPRSETSSLHVSTVQMPDVLGAMDDVDRLWRRTKKGKPLMFGVLPPKPFDRAEHSSRALGLAMIAFSTLVPMATARADDIPAHHPEFQRCMIRRDWCIGVRDGRLVDAIYVSVEEPNILVDSQRNEVDRSNQSVAADLLDCEEMIRKIRFVY